MKWLLMVVAFVLGAAITWLLTVKRVTRVVPTEDQAPGGAGASADAEDAEDEASRFGGAHTPTSDTPGAAEAWDRDAEDEDALMSDRTHEAGGDPSMPPVADATPNGDLAGVGAPDGVAAIDEQVEQHAEVAEAGSSGAPGSGDAKGGPVQGHVGSGGESEPTEGMTPKAP